jgi:hypothetical protein
MTRSRRCAIPFQNLRSTRETELAEAYPIHVVIAWLGNSDNVAREHSALQAESLQKRSNVQALGVATSNRPV